MRHYGTVVVGACSVVPLKSLEFPHADQPHPVRLLRACCERPRGRAAEKGDELAPFHVAPLPWQLAKQLLRDAHDVVFTVI